MIARTVLSRAIGRLRLMAMFPGSDPDVLAALGAEVMEICENDAAVNELVGEVARCYDTWPGIKAVRETAASIMSERIALENSKQNRAQCRDHEASCPGYAVVVDETSRTVTVSFCEKLFEKRGLGYSNGESAECRRGDALKTSDPGFVERLLAEELGKRPGYESFAAYMKRSDDEFFRKMKKRIA